MAEPEAERERALGGRDRRHLLGQQQRCRVWAGTTAVPISSPGTGSHEASNVGASTPVPWETHAESSCRAAARRRSSVIAAAVQYRRPRTPSATPIRTEPE